MRSLEHTENIYLHILAYNKEQGKGGNVQIQTEHDSCTVQSGYRTVSYLNYAIQQLNSHIALTKAEAKNQ